MSAVLLQAQPTNPRYAWCRSRESRVSPPVVTGASDRGVKSILERVIDYSVISTYLGLLLVHYEQSKRLCLEHRLG